MSANWKFGFGQVENIVGKGENAGIQHCLLIRQCFLFYTPVEEGTYYGITCGVRAGGVPILCPEHISKTMLATVMKFRGWIDLEAECSAQESTLACLIFE